jgi:spore coat protein U-like protein
MNWGVLDRCDTTQRIRRGFCAALALAAAGLISAPAQAQTATATAEATVVEPLSLIKTQDLDFGLVAASSAAGTVTIDPDTGVCTGAGGVVSAGNCSYAEFAGMGVRRLTFRAQIPASVTITGPGGATMTVTNLTMGLAPDVTFIGGNGNGLGNGRRRYQINSATGIFTFRLGGQLNVGANQTPGTYSGTFDVIVQYQ